MDDTLAFLSAHELLERYARGDLSPVEVAVAANERAEALGPALNALTTATPELAVESARESERRWRAGDARPLEGVPVVVKDIFDTAGVRTTYGSSVFAAHVPDRDAVAVRRLLDAGAVLVGKAATHEFAWGITTDNPHHGPTRNPWAPDRVPGGSSGGSGAALATGIAPLALGSDTAGSIRIPAAFCGVVGLKPTYAAVDPRGAWPLAPSLDHVGPMARTAADAALMLAVLAGAPAGDAGGAAGLEGLTVGVCPDLDQASVSAAAAGAREAAATALARLGAGVVEVTFRDAPPIFDTLLRTAMPEASYVHRTAGLWPDRRDAYGDDVGGRLDRAAGVGLDDYLAAAEARRRLTAGLRERLREVDVLLTPVAPTTPVRVGEETDDFRELVITSTAPQNLSGLPAIAVRAGFDEHGIPVGVQLTGPPDGERVLVRVAAALEAATPDLHARRPQAALG